MTPDPFEAAQRARGELRDREIQQPSIPQPGQRIRLARRIGFHPPGAEAVVVECPPSSLNGYAFAADFGGGDLDTLCLDLEDVEPIQ